MSIPYIIGRLRRDHPELASEVVEGRMSAHAAAVRAGIRRRYFQVPANSVDEALVKVIDHYGLDEVRRALTSVEPWVEG